MASIQPKKRKHGTTYYIIQRYLEPDGKENQYWIHCKDEKEAQSLLEDVKSAENAGVKFVRPVEVYTKTIEEDITVEEMLEHYIETKKKEWQPSTLTSSRSVSRNHIVPYIGTIPLRKLTPMMIQDFYNRLPQHSQARGNHTGDIATISARGVKEVHKLLRPMLDMAVVWGILPYNPSYSVKLPKQQEFTREQWTENTLQSALSICEDPFLCLAVETQFNETTRSGELSALTWDCVFTSEDEIKGGSARLVLDKTMSRLSREAIAETGVEIVYEFPTEKATKTVVVLKRPKTQRSRRIVYLPPTLARKYNEHRERQQEMKTILGDRYHDHNLVFCRDNGDPYETKYLAKRFKDYCKQVGVPPVDFYSLRHSGATSKLRATRDIKAVQGDMGHNSPQMLTKVYAAILDEDRRKNAAVMEERFYGDSKDIKYQKDV